MRRRAPDRHFSAAELVGDPLIAAIVKLVAAQPDAVWCGSSRDLLDDLNASVPAETRRNRLFWPSNPMGLSRRMNRMKDGLRAANLVINYRERGLCITRIEALAA